MGLEMLKKAKFSETLTPLYLGNELTDPRILFHQSIVLASPKVSAKFNENRILRLRAATRIVSAQWKVKGKRISTLSVIGVEWGPSGARVY
jgi:hypothetical protein